MTVNFFMRRRPDGAPSTQFAATILAMPGPDLAAAAAAADAPNPDTVSPDSLAYEASGSNAAVPDLVTDIGGLPGEAPDPADAPTLSHIGRYALKRQLGAGGLGTVFEAWDPLLSRAVAVKTLQFELDAGAREALDGLFLNEARAAAGLNHRYIVTIHDAGLSPHGVYIAMERLYGRDLHCALADGWRPTVEQSVQLVRRVTEALAYAHARGVVHCDIKPANIFLQRRDRPKVLDFGIARIVHGRTLPALEGAVVGSPRYRAPEQLTGGAVDARTDLYSLGVVLHELLTGRRAFEGESLAQINEAVLNHELPAAHVLNPGVPPELSAIVTRLTARAPADRYTCASELGADLRRWTHQQQTSQTAPPAAAVPAAGPTRAPGPRTLLLAGGLLAAAALAVAWVGTQRPATPHEQVAAIGAPALLAGTAAPATPAPPVPAAPADGPLASEAAATAGTAASLPVVGGETAGPATPLTRTAAAPAEAGPRPRADGRTRATPPAGSTTRDGGADGSRGVAQGAAAPVLGTVQFAVSPWASVEVNGSASGVTPPLSRLSLPAGTHSITLRNADFPPVTVQVQVGADQAVTLRHRFGS